MPSVANVSAAHDVHCGKDGWLFLVGGSNDVLSYCTVRDKITVYHDKFNGALPYRQQSPALRLPEAARSAGLDDEIVDVVPYFARQKHRHKLFWQTDTHWTFDGCRGAYRVLCRQLGLRPNPAIIRDSNKGPKLLLDLGQKLDPPVREEFYMGGLLKQARRVAANPIVSWKERHGLENDGQLHVGSNVVFRNHHHDAVDQCVVLFGDSFSEYRPHLLTGMLAATFREVHFVWSASIDWNYVQRAKPDLLVTEAAERFAAQVPVDDFDLDRYTVERLAPLMSTAKPG